MALPITIDYDKLAQRLIRKTDFKTAMVHLKAAEQAYDTVRTQFLNMVHEYVKAEFINGEIVMQSPVSKGHWQTCSKLMARMLIYVEDHKLGSVGAEEVMIKVGPHYYEPDIVYFTKEQDALTNDDELIFPVPALVVEVLSKSTARIDRGQKMRDYAAYGVEEYILVDSRSKTFEQYLLSSGLYHLSKKYSIDEVYESRVIYGFSVSLAAVID